MAQKDWPRVFPEVLGAFSLLPIAYFLGMMGSVFEPNISKVVKLAMHGVLDLFSRTSGISI